MRCAPEYVYQFLPHLQRLVTNQTEAPVNSAMVIAIKSSARQCINCLNLVLLVLEYLLLVFTNYLKRLSHLNQCLFASYIHSYYPASTFLPASAPPD
mgnify:CR=1 FL=1